MLLTVEITASPIPGSRPTGPETAIDTSLPWTSTVPEVSPGRSPRFLGIELTYFPSDRKRGTTATLSAPDSTRDPIASRSFGSPNLLKPATVRKPVSDSTCEATSSTPLFPSFVPWATIRIPSMDV